MPSGPSNSASFSISFILFACSKFSNATSASIKAWVCSFFAVNAVSASFKVSPLVVAACKEAKANALSSTDSFPFAAVNASKGSFAAPAAVANILPLGVADNKFNPVLVKNLKDYLVQKVWLLLVQIC